MKIKLTPFLLALILTISYSFAPLALAPTAAAASPLSEPAALAIPAIGLGSPVIPMGLTKEGDLDVPDGATNNVGWYQKGVVPGQQGAAVLDAHVYAAFKNLDQLEAGQDIYVAMQDGTSLHFKVTGARVYKLSELSPQELFNKKGGRYLHLITCAGALTPDRSTYTHRLVVYAELVD